MQLLAILLSLGLNQSTDVVDRFRKPAWFHVYAAWVREKALPLGLWNGAVGVVVLLAPLFAAGVALQWWLAGLPLGLNQLLLGVPALLFAFGTDRTDDHVARFVESWSAREMGAAREAAAALNPGRPLTVEEERLPEFAVRGLFSHVHERLFGALFWFLILGPVGALAYRLTALARDFGGCHANAGPGYCDAANGAFWLVSWIPARLTAASFAVAGSFSHCIEAWRSAGRR
ncbi:MAG: regulatory signaling modulator protein AmpE, partial [Ectothiorhodospiraceae bacterium]